MSDEMNVNAYVSSPYSSDMKKQQLEELAQSAQNIRKVTESVKIIKPVWLSIERNFKTEREVKIRIF